jgi:hypothetical protein
MCEAELAAAEPSGFDLRTKCLLAGVRILVPFTALRSMWDSLLPGWFKYSGKDGFISEIVPDSVAKIFFRLDPSFTYDHSHCPKCSIVHSMHGKNFLFGSCLITDVLSGEADTVCSEIACVIKSAVTRIDVSFKHQHRNGTALYSALVGLPT